MPFGRPRGHPTGRRFEDKIPKIGAAALSYAGNRVAQSFGAAKRVLLLQRQWGVPLRQIDNPTRARARETCRFT